MYYVGEDYLIHLRLSLGVTVRLLHCNLEITGLSHGNNLFIYDGKAAYIEPSPDPAMAGASCTRLPSH